MKKPTLLVLSLFILQSINSQMLKEVISFHENGNPKEINFKNENLKIVKTQEFDFEKNLISEFNYNPKTGILDGDFKDFNNIGFYNNGELNCTNCKISFHNGTQLRGDFKDGRPYGKIEIYKVSEIQNRQTNNYTSYLLSLEYGRRIQYDEMIGTGEYIYEKRLELEYNSNGNLDGIYQINSQTKLYFDNGKMIGFTINNFENQSIKKDSIFRDNKIWLSNNEFKKNTGWINMSWNVFLRPWNFTYDIPDDYGEFFGGSNTVIGDVEWYVKEHRKIGIEYKTIDKSFWKNESYTEENLIALIRLYLKSLNNSFYHEGKKYVEFYYLQEYGDIVKVQREPHPQSSEYTLLNFVEIEDLIIQIIQDLNKFIEIYYYNYNSRKYESFKEKIISINLNRKKKIEWEKQIKIREEQKKKDVKFQKESLSNFCLKNSINFPENYIFNPGSNIESSFLSQDIYSVENRISEIKSLFSNEYFSLRTGNLVKKDGNDNVYIGVVYGLDFLKKPKISVREKCDEETLKILYKNFSFVRIYYYFDTDEVVILHPTDWKTYCQLF